MASGMEVVELDATPSSGDKGVQNVLRNLDDDLHLKNTISMIESVGKYMYVSTNAAARDAKQLVKVQDCLFNIIKLTDACSLMMQSFQSGAYNILEKLKVAYLYLLDGFPDFAMTDIEAISKDVGSMQSAVDKHLKSEKKTAEKITDTHAVVKEELGKLQPKVRAIEELEKKKKQEVAGQKRGIHGAPSNGGEGEVEAGTGEDPPAKAKTRISKLYVFMLVLVAVKYWCGCGVCEQFSSYMDKFGCKGCLQVQSVICTVVLLVLLLKWVMDSDCRNKANVVLACALCGLLFGSVSPQKDGGLIRNSASQSLSYGSSMFAEAYSGEHDGTENIWFGSDGSKSHKTKAEVKMATKADATGFAINKAGDVPDNTAETNGNTDGTANEGTCSNWDLFYVHVCYIPGTRTRAFAKQLKRRNCGSDCKPECCYPPNPWYPLLSLPVILNAVYSQARKNLDDSFFGPNVLILQLVMSVSIWCPLPNTILEYLGPFEIANIGVISSGIFALVISVSILRARSKGNQTVDGFTVRPTRGDIFTAEEELLEIQRDLKLAKTQLESTELTDLLFERSLPYLLGIEDILSKSITLVETWYKECKGVVEPNMGRNIGRAASIDENDRKQYWSSMQFKQEVVGYYCRWKALQVYCEDNRKFIRTARQKIETWYTENLHPREAVAKSWTQAAELDDPEVQAFLRTHGRGGM